MRNKPLPQPGQVRRIALSKPAAITAIFLGLHILPLFWRPDLLWGVDFLVYLPSSFQAAFVLLAVFLFIPAVRRRIRTYMTALPGALWGRGRRVWITRSLMLLVACAAFVAFSSVRHFLGDGYTVIDGLESDTLKQPGRAPLSFTLVRMLHIAGRVYWNSAETTYQILSYASGVFYLVFAFATSATLGKNALEKSIVLAFLLTTGYMQLFFGYVENYALYMPGLLLYLLMGLRTVAHRLPLYAPALLLGVLLALHQAFAAFAPSLLYLAYRAHRHRQDILPAWKNAAVTSAALCCVPASAALFLGLSGVGFEAYLSRTGSRDFLPLFADPGFDVQYRVFSLAHVLDFLNQQLLSAPAACMAFFLLRRGKPAEQQPFLIICAFVPLFFTFMANPYIGAFRDWDVMSLPALPFTLWAASALLKSMRHRTHLFHSAFLICGAAGLHCALWIGLNANIGSSEARFVNLLDGLKGGGSLDGWLTMGKFHERQGDNAAARQAFRRSIDADPTNPNRWLTVGAFCRETGQYTYAFEYYNKAVELVPDSPIPYMNLGAVHSDLGQFDKAIEYTRKAIALDPKLDTAHLNLGQMYRRVGQLAKAISALEKAAQLRPQDANIQENLANLYQDLGENEKAIHHFERANSLRPRHASTLVNLAIAYSDVGRNGRTIELLKAAVAVQPEFATAHLNLGVAYNRIGQYDTGIQYLNKALEIEPDNPHAYTNLGFVYKKQGRYQEAIGHLEKALELLGEKANAMAYLIIGNTYYDMGEHESAIPYLQKAIHREPNHAKAHLLLGQSFRALKRGDQAIAYFEKTLELEPGHPRAAQIRQWVGQIRERGEREEE